MIDITQDGIAHAENGGWVGIPKHLCPNRNEASASVALSGDLDKPGFWGMRTKTGWMKETEKGSCVWTECEADDPEAIECWFVTMRSDRA